MYIHVHRYEMQRRIYGAMVLIDSLSISLGVGLSVTFKAGVECLGGCGEL